MFKSAVASITLAFVAMGSAQAEPGPNVTLLMNTPTSLLSFGLYRLDEMLDENLGYRGIRTFVTPLSGRMAYSTTAYYDWDRNRIVLRAMDFEDKPDGWDREAECAQVVAAVRSLGGIQLSGELSVYLKQSIFSDYFMPIGYSTKSLEEVPAALDSIIEIVFQAGLVTPFSCTAPLLGTGYSVHKTSP